MKLTFELNPNGTIATATFDNIYINTKITPIALFVTEILKLQVSQICIFLYVGCHGNPNITMFHTVRTKIIIFS